MSGGGPGSRLQAAARAADNRDMRPLARPALLLLAAALAAGCGNLLDGDAVRSALDTRGRDSVLARSALPGAGVAARAVAESDRAVARAAGVNAALDSLAR